MISAPYHYVVAYTHKRLDGIILEEEAVFPKHGIVPDKSSTTDITSGLITLVLCVIVKPCS